MQGEPLGTPQVQDVLRAQPFTRHQGAPTGRVGEPWAGLHLRGEAGVSRRGPFGRAATWGGAGLGGGRPPRCASFLAFLGRAAGRRGRGGGSRAAGMQTPVGGVEKKGGCVCYSPANLAGGCTRPPALSPKPRQQGTWGSLGMAVAPSPAWSPSVSLRLTGTGAGQAARGRGMRGRVQGSLLPSPAESSAPCSQPRCHQLGCLGDRRDAAVPLGRELGFPRKGCAARLRGCSLLLQPKSSF